MEPPAGSADCYRDLTDFSGRFDLTSTCGGTGSQSCSTTSHGQGNLSVNASRIDCNQEVARFFSHPRTGRRRLDGTNEPCAC